jgi:hypothetical protein
MLLVGPWTMFGNGYGVPMTTRTQVRSITNDLDIISYLC